VMSVKKQTTKKTKSLKNAVGFSEFSRRKSFIDTIFVLLTDNDINFSFTLKKSSSHISYLSAYYLGRQSR
jgi:hypothetical protein